MRRRDVIKAIACSAFAWPPASLAQQPARRIGVLMHASPDNSDFQRWLEVFLQALSLSGWTDGQNVRVETRWTGGDAVTMRRQVAELIALAPDVIVAHGASAVGPLLQATRTIPVVFPIVSDPVGAGFVESLARPGGNATGFMSTEYSMGGKWLELLKDIAPHVTRAGVLRDASQGSGTSQFAAIQAVANTVGMEVAPINMRDADDIERGVAAFARTPHGGLILAAGPSATRYRELIVTLAARHKLPAVYYERFFVLAGGLIAYGTDFAEHYRRSANYVARILNGEKPADLPVQSPTTYRLTINLRTAKALGLEVPQALLARADEVIE